uniref:Uncharacterized protein n=1 Tax=Ixodes ricinus TaxID=34613 RepID=A0A147BDJ2_IXORI
MYLMMVFFAGAVLKSNGIPHLFSKPTCHLIRNTFCHRHGCYSSWLRAANHSILAVPIFVQVLSELCCLSRASFTNYDDNVIFPDNSEKLLSRCKDWQVLSLLQQRFHSGKLAGSLTSSVFHVICKTLLRLVVGILVVILLVFFFLHAQDVSQLGSRKFPLFLLSFLPLLLLPVVADNSTPFSRHDGHVRRRVFHGHHGFRLLREHDPAIQERGDNVVHKHVHPSLVVLLEVFVDVHLQHDSAREHPIRLPLLVVLVDLPLLRRHLLDLLLLQGLLLPLCVLLRHAGERVVDVVVALVQAVPLPVQPLLLHLPLLFLVPVVGPGDLVVLGPLAAGSGVRLAPVSCPRVILVGRRRSRSVRRSPVLLVRSPPVGAFARRRRRHVPGRPPRRGIFVLVPVRTGRRVFRPDVGCLRTRRTGWRLVPVSAGTVRATRLVPIVVAAVFAVVAPGSLPTARRAVVFLAVFGTGVDSAALTVFVVANPVGEGAVHAAGVGRSFYPGPSVLPAARQGRFSRIRAAVSLFGLTIFSGLFGVLLFALLFPFGGRENVEP